MFLPARWNASHSAYLVQRIARSRRRGHTGTGHVRVLWTCVCVYVWCRALSWIIHLSLVRTSKLSTCRGSGDGRDGKRWGGGRAGRRDKNKRTHWTMVRRSGKKAGMAEWWFPLGSGDGEHICVYQSACSPLSVCVFGQWHMTHILKLSSSICVVFSNGLATSHSLCRLHVI